MYYHFNICSITVISTVLYFYFITFCSVVFQEMWSLFDFVHQGTLLGTARTFKMEYENPITRVCIHYIEHKKGFVKKKHFDTEYGILLLNNLSCVCPFQSHLGFYLAQIASTNVHVYYHVLWMFFLILGKGKRCHSQWEKTWNGNGGKLKTDNLPLLLTEDQGWGYWQWGQGGAEFLLINPDLEVSWGRGLAQYLYEMILKSKIEALNWTVFKFK